LRAGCCEGRAGPTASDVDFGVFAAGRWHCGDVDGANVAAVGTLFTVLGILHMRASVVLAT